MRSCKYHNFCRSARHFRRHRRGIHRPQYTADLRAGLMCARFRRLPGTLPAKLEPFASAVTVVQTYAFGLYPVRSPHADTKVRSRGIPCSVQGATHICLRIPIRAASAVSPRQQRGKRPLPGQARQPAGRRQPWRQHLVQRSLATDGGCSRGCACHCLVF